MGCVRLSVVLLIAIIISAMTVLGKQVRVNQSTSGLFWSTSKEDGDFIRKEDSEEPVALTENDELDGGFSSLEGMLQWAIGHSDPAKLKESAENVQHQRMSDDELKKRQVEIQELMEKLKVPSDAELMKIAINDLNNSSVSVEDRLRALEELLLLVEPIDNANDLDKLGGLNAVARQLDNVDPEVRKLAAWVLGKASQNNPVVQQQVLELGTLGKLIKMVKSDFTEEATKALYAVSAVIRNNVNAQEVFYAEAGDLMLKDILSNSAVDVRLRRKCVFLVGDLAESQLENGHKAKLPFFSDHVFLNAVVNLTFSDDLDLQEKTLVAIKNLLELRVSEASVFRELCALDKALESMRLQLQQVMEDETRKDYAMDVEILRREVELIFYKKLDKEFDSQYIEHTISSLPCFERYAMKPFFGQHENVIDLNLEDYIKHKIPFGPHTTDFRLLALERHLIGEGSHRRLSSSVEFRVPQDLSADFSAQICEVIIIERLPSGVFADPFELDHILHRGVFKDAFVFGDTNLELPSFLSNQSVVEIHLDAALNTSPAQEIVKEFKIEIPLHARYPPLEESGYATVRFDFPDLFLRCKSKNNEEEPARTCLLTPIAGSDGKKAHDIKWSIPAGMAAHAPIVSVITFISALFSVVVIVIASLKHTRMDSVARFKQS